MAFENNNTLGRGRKKGSQNFCTASIKQNLQSLVESNLINLNDDLKSLSPKDRVKAVIDLCKYVVPSLKQVDAEVTNGGTDLNFLSQYSEEELYKILKS